MGLPHPKVHRPARLHIRARVPKMIDVELSIKFGAPRGHQEAEGSPRGRGIPRVGGTPLLTAGPPQPSRRWEQGGAGLQSCERAFDSNMGFSPGKFLFNRQLELVEIAISHSKQRTGTLFNRQLFPLFGGVSALSPDIVSKLMISKDFFVKSGLIKASGAAW
jgi:hypothetical protein